ncbi:MAG: hypothetical protein JNM17_04145 [Archangium sp.]|nr:hypothetical protein [Archangium sp.]
MSFDTIAGLPGLERIIRCDVSLNGFSSIAYRYATRAGRYDGTNWWTRRIPTGGLGSISRRLGRDRIAAASTTSLVLENADGGVDWICGREHIADAAAARFRIYIGVFQPGPNPPAHTDIQWKQLGEFVCAQWPKQNNDAVQIALSDDFMGRLGSGLQLPTIADWKLVGNTSNNPIYSGVGLPSTLTVDTPLQLAFGEDWLLALPHIIAWGNSGVGQTYEAKIIVPICATADLSAVSQDLIQDVRVEWLPPPETLEDNQRASQVIAIQRSGSIQDGTANAPTTFTTWTVEKSPTITKGGKSFQIVYLVVRADLGDARFEPVGSSPDAAVARAVAGRQSELAYQGGYPPDAVDSIATPSPAGQSVTFARRAARVLRWYVKGRFSAVTNPPGTLGMEHSVDAMVDLVSVYSSATVNSTEAARTKAGAPFASCFGVVQPWTEKANKAENGEPLPLSLRQVLSALAQSSDIDIFQDWTGLISFASDVYDFTIASSIGSMLEFRETEVRIERWVPSAGERGAAFNRVFFDGGRGEPVLGEGVPFQGPFDVSASDIPVATRVVEAVFQQGWRPRRQQAQNPLTWRALDGRTRDRIRMRTHRGGLRLELGGYFKVTWTRGSSLGGPYSGSVFQCDGLVFNPADDSVDVEALWRDDVQTERSYILDDETLLVRSKGGLSGNCTENATPEVFDFGGTINLTTMGVVNGDILIIREASEAADSFLYNRTYRIAQVNSTTQIEVHTAHTETGHVTANAEWSIVRGATTYPTAISDPTNYPSGGDLYGKVTQASGLYSDSSTGNRLLSG